MNPAIEKLEALLSRVQHNRTQPRTVVAVSLPTRAQPLALDEPLDLPPAAIVAASAPVQARHPAPVADDEPELTIGESAVEDDDDDAEDTGERVAARAPSEPPPYEEPAVAVQAAVRLTPPPPAPSAPLPMPAARAPISTSAATAAGPPPLRPEARSATPARPAPAAPVSEEVPTTTRETPPSRKPIEAAPLETRGAVAKVVGASASAPRTFGALVARSLALRPKRS